MASLYKKPITKTDPKTGEKVKTRSKKWWGRYRTANGKDRRVPLAADKTAAQAMLNDLVRKAERVAAGIVDPYETHRKRPLTEHLSDFKKDLKNKGSTPNYVQTTYQRAHTIAEAAGFKTINELSPSCVLDVLAAKRKEGISIASSNHYQRAIKMFTRWLVRDRRMADDPLSHLAAMNKEVDRRRVRRPLTTEEITILVEKTPIHKQPRRRMNGEDRALLYIVAVYTGLRRNEIASITPVSFDFDSEPPTVTVEAGYSKRRQKDVLPLRHDFVERIRAWVEQRPDLKTSDIMFPIKNLRTSDMLRKDLGYARSQWIAEAKTDDERSQREASSFLAYEDEQGHVVDFHSLRKTFITNLTKSGVAPKTAQLLARHSDINLTMNTYTTLGVLDQAAAMESLPAVPTGETKKAENKLPLQATGTDDQDRAFRATSEVPTMVPKGAENGANQLTLSTLQLASDCTETTAGKGQSRSAEEEENPDKNGPIRTRKGQPASMCSEVPEGGLEPPRPCGHWILNPASWHLVRVDFMSILNGTLLSG